MSTAASGLLVATVPDTHPYLDAVRPDSVRHVRFTPATATGWEASPLLDPLALSTVTLAGLDVVHVHFGYEGCSPAQLEDFVARVRAAGPALVVTVHDLRNPHDRDPSRHLEHLRILLAAADAVITLTPGAAAEIARRWSRPATVVPHPTLIAPSADDGSPLARPGSPRVVGIHLKNLRTNVVEPVELVAAAAAGAVDAGARLRVDVHDHGVDQTVLTELTRLADRGRIELRRHPYFTDDELVTYLRGLDVSVLPYRFGTHSGWLELCRDLGVAVVAPDCGFYAQQWAAVTTYGNNESIGLDAGSLRRAVRLAATAPQPAPADATQRQAERAQAQDAHARVYAEALSAPCGTRPSQPSRPHDHAARSAFMRVAWLIVGPPDHGVVILAEQLAQRLESPVVLRADDCAGLRARIDQTDGEIDVAHVHFTDRLFGADCDAAARAYVELAGHLGERGAGLAVTLHDLPVDPDDPRRYRRRAQAYASVVAVTTGAVILSSAYEADLLAAFCPDARPVVIALPIDAGPTVAAAPASGSSADVTVFGYLYPGKGHRAALEALAGLPPEVGLTVLGRVADGHADLAGELSAHAAELGRSVTITGWLDKDDIRPRLRAAGIPLVGHERMSASGSIGSWLSTGRRPLVPDVAYARELARRCPGAVTTYPPTAAGLSAALARAHADPGSTWLDADVTLGPSSVEVARAYRDAVGAEPSR